jgi:hypothetical protein
MKIVHKKVLFKQCAKCNFFLMLHFITHARAAYEQIKKKRQ